MLLKLLSLYTILQSLREVVKLLAGVEPIHDLH